MSKPGQPARLSHFGHFKGQINQSVKDNEDISHDTLTTVKILASNSKGSRRYESRKTANEQQNYRLLRSRTEMAVIPNRNSKRQTVGCSGIATHSTTFRRTVTTSNSASNYVENRLEVCQKL